MSDTADLSTFGGRVAHLRGLVGKLSGRELDALAGLHQGHVWQIEQGHRENPTRETVCNLARVFGCPAGWLIDGEGCAPSSEDVNAAVARARAAHGQEHAA